MIASSTTKSSRYPQSSFTSLYAGINLFFTAETPRKTLFYFLRRGNLRDCSSTRIREFVHNSFQAILQNWHVEVHQQSYLLIRQPQIGQKLGFVNRKQLFDCFDFYDDCVLDNQVEPDWPSCWPISEIVLMGAGINSLTAETPRKPKSFSYSGVSDAASLGRGSGNSFTILFRPLFRTGT
jgi:hypothetical protein